jgi:hypothetical protein
MSSQQKPSQPRNLGDVHDELLAGADFLPDDVKNQFLAGVVEASISQGCMQYIGNSPQAKQMAKIVDATSRMVPQCRRDAIISNVVSSYMAHKHSNRELKARSKEIASKVIFPQNTPISSQNDPSGGPSGHQVIRPSGMSSDCKPSPPHKKMWVVQVHQTVTRENVAMALDDLGPCVQVKRTEIANGKARPYIVKDWHIRVCKCIHPDCRSTIILYSPTKELHSSPGVYRIENHHSHYNHPCVSWLQWYENKEDYETSKGTQKWNTNIYTKEPGLPYMIKMGIAETIRSSPTVGNAIVADAIERRFNNHELFLVSPWIVALIKKHFKQASKRVKLSIRKELSTPTIIRAKYFHDLLELIEFHRIDYQRLKEIRYEPALRHGLAWVRSLALHLASTRVLKGLGWYQNLPERDLVVLDSDEVESDSRWQSLVQSKVHRTGKAPRQRTIDFSSVALLSIAVWCEKNNWNVIASCDGTHGMSKTDYKLVTLGITGFSSATGSRTFHPLVYGWGEGEREIVVVHTFLNLKIALRHLF